MSSIFPKKPKKPKKPKHLEANPAPLQTNFVPHIAEHDRLVSLLNFERYAIDQSHFSVSRESEDKQSVNEKSMQDAKDKKIQCYKRKLEMLEKKLKCSQSDMIKYFKNKLGGSKSSTAIQAPYRSDKPRVYKQYGEMIQLKGKVLEGPVIKIKKMTCSSEQRQGQPACKKTTECIIKPVKLQINSDVTRPSDIFSQRTKCAAAAAAGGGKINKKK